ncbi:alpha-hydroxy acid oxidase [Sphingoaurantiacus capsulatus]|uniref:Alpha-hydroxy acid oxidase n=1 Tax=Sphingoaurantiacus capsulatus TaxID=1771310 RepID=A0ABV7XCM2_9SPHN
MALPPLSEIPPTVASVDDYEGLARERLDAGSWAYLTAGAGDESTVAENRSGFARWQLRTRVLRNLSGGSTAIDLFGTRLAAPILLAPVAFQKLAHPDGELAAAVAASALQAGMVVSTQASVAIEDIAAAASTPLWFQLYIQHDRDFTRALVARAEAAGYAAIVVTVDAPTSGRRDAEQRAGFAFPPGIEAVNLRGLAPPPRAAADALLLGTPLLDAAPRWEDLAWLRTLTRLPILVKGIMDGDDARRAVAAGIDGIIVSNHGGRTLDSQPATIAALPEIVAAVGGQVPVLVDGGIRSGTDIFKTLALGARAVLVGRPFVYGLAAAGAVGVAHVLRILRAELEVAMALTGCPTLAAIDTDALRRCS